MNLIAAIDIGGTKMQVALLSTSGKILYRLRISTHEKNQSAPTRLRALAHSIQKQIGVGSTLIACGVAFAGRVDPSTGSARPGPNFHWNVPRLQLRTILENILGVPCIVDNDAHCFTLAEACIGKGKKFRHVAGITLGTGIGGALVINKEIYRGADNTAGEIGHLSLETGVALSEHGQWLARCGDGFYGHWEAFSSGTAMRQWYEHFGGGSGGARAVEDAGNRGEESALSVINIAQHYLAQGIVNLLLAYNPDIVVIAGGLIRMKPLFKNLGPRVKKLSPFKLTTRIALSALGDDAPLLGAALLTGKIKITRP